MSESPMPISTMPCPFCGSTYAHKIEAKFGKPPHVQTGYRLQCSTCDAQTGIGGTDEIIKGYWERRLIPEESKAMALLRELAECAPVHRWKEYEDRGEQRIPCYIQVETAEKIMQICAPQAQITKENP